MRQVEPSHLLIQLEHILESDPLIDEVGFVHPSQFLVLNDTNPRNTDRRWAIKMISQKFSNLQEILEKESELVKVLAQKSKMNYRAWNHRCWLVSYMSRCQDELDRVEGLIKRYIGREALWLHRRFLSVCRIKHFAAVSLSALDHPIDKLKILLEEACPKKSTIWDSLISLCGNM